MEAMRWMIMPMADWMALRSSGNGRWNSVRRAVVRRRAWVVSGAMGLRVVWWK